MTEGNRDAVIVGLIVAVAAGLSALALAPAFSTIHGELAVSREFRRPSVQKTFSNTLRIATEVVAASAAIGIPIVVLLRIAPKFPKRALRTALLLPLIANPLALILSWYVLLQRNGLLVECLEAVGVLKVRESLLFSEPAVVMVMTYLLFPFLVIFTESAWALVPGHTIMAARSLGATRVQTFVRLELFVLARGFSRGAAYVFVMATGYFVVPALLGGTEQTMLGQLIVDEVNVRGNLVRAAAYAVPLVATTLVSVAVLFTVVRGRTDA